MRKLSYISTIIFSIILFVSHVNAECTPDEINKLKIKADEIKITYELLKIPEESSPTYFNVNIKNIPNDFYIIFEDDKLVPNNSLITTQMVYGTKKIVVYSNDCTDNLKVMTFKLPRFNSYSLDPLCDDVDGDDFALCGKYYDYDVSYDNFVKRVTSYKNSRLNEEKEKQKNGQDIL